MSVSTPAGKSFCSVFDQRQTPRFRHRPKLMNLGLGWPKIWTGNTAAMRRPVSLLKTLPSRPQRYPLAAWQEQRDKDLMSSDQHPQSEGRHQDGKRHWPLRQNSEVATKPHPRGQPPLGAKQVGEQRCHCLLSTTCFAPVKAQRSFSNRLTQLPAELTHPVSRQSFT